MPRADLLGKYELRQRGTGHQTLVSEIWHVEWNSAGGSVSTPVGWLVVVHIPWEAEEHEHWEIEVFLRRARKDLLDKDLPAGLIKWLENEVALSEPFVLNVHHTDQESFVSRGKLFEDDDE